MRCLRLCPQNQQKTIEEIKASISNSFMNTHQGNSTQPTRYQSHVSQPEVTSKEQSQRHAGLAGQWFILGSESKEEEWGTRRSETKGREPCYHLADLHVSIKLLPQKENPLESFSQMIEDLWTISHF